MSSPHDSAWLEVSGLPTTFDSWCRNYIQGAEVRMQIIGPQDAGSLILPLRGSRLKISYDTKAAAGVNWMGCVLGGLSVCTTRTSAKVARECWRLPETASSIVHHFPLLSISPIATYTQQFTPRESSKFSSSLWAAIGWTVPTWQNPIGWQRERETWALKRQTAVQSRQADNGCFRVLWDNVHLEYDTVFCAYDLVLKGRS